MLDIEKVKARILKNDEERYGVSLVYFPDAISLAVIRAWLDKLDILYDGTFTWYPAPHLSLVRCRSIMTPFMIKDTANLCCDSVKQEKTHSIKANIGNDGILRISFASITLEGISDVDPFYISNELQYDLIKNPSMSLGLINIEHENAAETVTALGAILNNGQFPRFEMTIDELSAVSYSDILLKNHTLIKRINLI